MTSMDTETAAPPFPELFDWNRPFFEGAQDGKLVLQHCESCGKVIYYPRIACPGCLSDQLTWKEVAGAGEIYSYSVVWRPKHPVFDPLVPIVLVAVRLDAGPMMITTLEDCEHDQVEIGGRVEAVFRAVAGGPTLPRFRPATV